MSNVHTLAEERAARLAGEIEMDEDLAAVLAAADPLPVAPLRNLSPIEAQWLRFRDQFAEAMQGGLHTVESLETDVANGDAYFWPGRDCAVIAKRVVYPNGEAVMQTQWAVGDLEEVLSLAPGIEAAARLVGCSRMLIEGRKGWERVMKAHGYTPWSVTLEKVL